MNADTFDPMRFYESYPEKVIARPGYPAKAAYKSTLTFGLYGKRILREIEMISTYADIGGCFGFGANAMSFHISKHQAALPRTFVFEISEGFVNVGKVIFPKIEFVEEGFDQYIGDVNHFDLVSLFDVVEHIVDPKPFLRSVSAKSRYVLLMTPMETRGILRGNKPPLLQGKNHRDGHVNFFTPASYESLLTASNFDILESHLIKSIIRPRNRAILSPESPEITDPGMLNAFKRPKRLILSILHGIPGVPWRLKQYLFGGGYHICLCRSRSLGQ